MMVHIDNWLDAYLDGELHNAESAQFERHLADCRRCQELLAERQALSLLLQEFPAAEGLKPEAQFLAEVRQKVKAQRSGWQMHRVLRLSWQFAPLGLLLAWIFLQTITVLSNLLAFIPGAEQVLKTKVSTVAQAPGFLESGVAALGLDWLNLAGFPGLLSWNGITNLILLACIGLLYLGWLASWWVRTQQNTGFGQVKQKIVR